MSRARITVEGECRRGHLLTAETTYRGRWGNPMCRTCLAERQVKRPLLEKFLAKASRGDGCWEWAGCRNNEGYGQIRVDAKTDLAHRVAYQLFVGPIPDGLTIDHLCRNRSCVNPDHLEPVSLRENILRAVAAVQQCRKGHPLTPENTYANYRGYRECRTCMREERRRYKAKRRARDAAMRAAGVQR